jgi:hypothetical protein
LSNQKRKSKVDWNGSTKVVGRVAKRAQAEAGFGGGPAIVGTVDIPEVESINAGIYFGINGYSF